MEKNKSITRETKHILKFANLGKLNKLDDLFKDYELALQECIDSLYNEDLKIEKILSSKHLPAFNHLKHSQWKQIIYKQASEIVRGTIEADEYQKRQRYKKVYKYFLKKGRQKKFLAKHFHELNLKKYTKPVVKNVSISLDERVIDFRSSTKFNYFIRIKFPYFQEGKKKATTANYPIKLTKQDQKFNNWNKKNSVRLLKINNSYYINFIYQKPKPELKETGEAIAFDFGIKKLLTSSRGEFFGTEIEKICNEITNCKRNSNHYKRLLRKRSQYINTTIKDLNLTNVKKIFIEDLKDLKRNSKKRGKSKRSFRNNFQYCLQGLTQARLEAKCEEQGIELVKVSPAYTSQTCSRCKNIDKASRNGENYHCSTCGLDIDADYNGAINILHRGVYSPSSTGK